MPPIQPSLMFEPDREFVSVAEFAPTTATELADASDSQILLSRRADTLTVLAKRNPDGTAKPLSRFNGANVAAARLSGRKRLRTRFVADARFGAKGEADRKAAREQGCTDRTIRNARRRAEALGVDLIERLRETSLRTDTQLDALLKLKAEQRKDLVRRALEGENVSAVAALGEARKAEAERTNSEEARFLQAWLGLSATAKLRFLKSVRDAVIQPAPPAALENEAAENERLYVRSNYFEAIEAGECGRQVFTRCRE